MNVKNIALVSLFFLFFSVLSVNSVKAVEIPDSIDFPSIKNEVGTRLNVSSTIGGYLCSAIVILMFMMPTIYLSRNTSKAFIVDTGVLLVTMGTCIGFTWLDTWFLLIIVIIVAISLANELSGRITLSSSNGVPQF